MNGKLYHMLRCESNLSIKKSAVLNISVLYIIALGLSVYKKITSNMTNTFRRKKKDLCWGNLSMVKCSSCMQEVLGSNTSQTLKKKTISSTCISHTEVPAPALRHHWRGRRTTPRQCPTTAQQQLYHQNQHFSWHKQKYHYLNKGQNNSSWFKSSWSYGYHLFQINVMF